MQNLKDFTQKIDEKFAADKEQILAYQLFLNRQHEARTTRLAIYTKIADRVLDIIIRPRMEKLVSYFENASLSFPDSNVRKSSVRSVNAYGGWGGPSGTTTTSACIS